VSRGSAHYLAADPVYPILDQARPRHIAVMIPGVQLRTDLQRRSLILVLDVRGTDAARNVNASMKGG
jgi:hypothetical protein